MMKQNEKNFFFFFSFYCKWKQCLHLQHLLFKLSHEAGDHPSSAKGVLQYNPTRTNCTGVGRSRDTAPYPSQWCLPGTQDWTGLGKGQVMCQLAEKFNEKELEIHRE